MGKKSRRARKPAAAAAQKPAHLVADEEQAAGLCVGTFRWALDKPLVDLPPFPTAAPPPVAA